MRRAGGLVMIAFGVAQLALIIALIQPVDWGWQVLGVLGTVYGLGLFAAILVVIAPADVQRKGLIRIATLIAAAAVLAAAASWASLAGGPLLFEADEAPRILIIIAADACLLAWAALLSFDPRPPNAPAIGVIAAFLILRTVVEWFYFLPILVPTGPTVEQPAGSSSGGTVLLFGAVVLGGYIVIAVWDLVLGVWLIKARLARAEGAPAPP
jgi:hypothetical protein